MSLKAANLNLYVCMGIKQGVLSTRVFLLYGTSVCSSDLM